MHLLWTGKSLTDDVQWIVTLDDLKVHCGGFRYKFQWCMFKISTSPFFNSPDWNEQFPISGARCEADHLNQVCWNGETGPGNTGNLDQILEYNVHSCSLFCLCYLRKSLYIYGVSSYMKSGASQLTWAPKPLPLLWWSMSKLVFVCLFVGLFWFVLVISSLFVWLKRKKLLQWLHLKRDKLRNRPPLSSD